MTELVPVKFVNRQGLALFGILHLPDAKQRRPTAILLLPPGVKMRVAPHRLYVKLAERFVALGFPVFRFDCHGLGDSEGELAETVLVRVYNSIHSGRYVDDTIDAMDWLHRDYGMSRFVLGGLCGGAITGLLAAQRDRRVEALLGIGIPAAFEGSEEHYGRYLTHGQLESLGRDYTRKLLQPKAILRFLTFQSSYSVIWRAVKARLRATPAQDARVPAADSHTARNNYNPMFGPAFFSMVQSSRKMLLIFSGADRWRWEFEEKFEQPNAGRLAPYRDFYEKHTIPNANHILSSDEWLGTALNLSEGWLRRIQGI